MGHRDVDQTECVSLPGEPIPHRRAAQVLRLPYDSAVLAVLRVVELIDAMTTRVTGAHEGTPARCGMRWPCTGRACRRAAAQQVADIGKFPSCYERIDDVESSPVDTYYQQPRAPRRVPHRGH